jgi:hypothetical protein
MFTRFLFLGLCVLYPKFVLQWFVASVLAFLAAYWTVAQANGIAEMSPFLGWFAADYIFIQVLFSILNRRKSHA